MANNVSSFTGTLGPSSTLASFAFNTLSSTAAPSTTGNIVYDIVPTDSPWPLQSAVALFEEHGGLALMQPNPAGSQEYHMFKACTEPQGVFASGENFQNCLAYPWISNAAFGEVNDSGPPFVDYGIFPYDNKNMKKIVKTISDCLEGYASFLPECIDPSSEDCPLSSCSFFGTTNYTLQFPVGNSSAGNGKPSSASSCINAFCKYVTRTAVVDADVGGIGVFISYLLQIGISLISWALLKYWDYNIWYHIVKAFHSASRRKSNLHERAAVRIRQKQDDHKDRLIESVVEFQKSQCYFMIPIQIAAIISIKTGGLDAETLQQVFNNYAFLMVLSIGGYLPITLILFVLRTLGYKSMYTTLLSVTSVALSGITLFMASRFSYVPDTLQPPPGIHYPGCGTISPVSYCLEGASGSFFFADSGSLNAVGATGPIPAFIFSVIILTFLCLDDFGIQDIRHLAPMREWSTQEEWSHERNEDDPAAHQFLSRHWYDFLRRIRIRSPKEMAKRAPIYINTIVNVLYLYFFGVYMFDLSRFRGHSDTHIPMDFNSWSFGQIVAITVWWPPLIQYAYLEINGMKGSRWHLPKGWVVVQQKPGQEMHRDVESGLPPAPGDETLIEPDRRSSQPVLDGIHDGDEQRGHGNRVPGR